MIDALKPYPEYKNTLLLWVGSMPAHWQLRRTKALFRERVEKGFPDEPLLAATQTKGVVRKEDYGSRTVTAQKDLHLLKLVEAGDFVISLRSFEGGIEVAHCRGIISPAYTVLEPRNEAWTCFYAHFFKSPDFIRSLTLFVTGIREGQNIDYKRMSRAYMPLPPQHEQEAIGRFLDHAKRRIDRFIRTKKKVITLLNEQKQAIIHRAVTCGLNGEAATKQSGLDWLPEVPVTWRVVRNQQIFRERNERGRGELPILAVSLRSGVTLGNDHDEDGRPRRTIDDRNSYKLALVGDVAYNMMRMWQGAVGVVPADGLVSPAYVVACGISELNPHYFVALFRTEVYRNEVNRNSRGIVSDRNRLYWDEFKQLLSPVPPLSEQNAIVAFINRRAAENDHAIENTRRKIALIHEYRTRLIADVVTGKLDVREVAANLPDEVDAGSEAELAGIVGLDEEEAGDEEMEAVSEEADT